MAKGTIKAILDRGFGFISTGEGTEIFFHRSDLQNVTFETQAADEGGDGGDDVSDVGGDTGN